MLNSFFGLSVLERRSIVLLLLTLFLINIFSLRYGFPQLLDPDEGIFVSASINMLTSPYLDPGWYGAPASTLSDALAVAYAGFVTVQLLLGASIEDVKSTYYQNPETYFFIGRVITLASYLLAVFAFYVVARKLFSFIASLISTISFSISPGIVSYSQIVRMDIFLILFLIILFNYCIRIYRGGMTRDYIFAGVAIGLATASKYPGIVGVFAFLTAALLNWRQCLIPWQTMAYRVVLAGGACLFAAFIAGPFLFINFSDVLKDVAGEARPSHLSATSVGFFSAIQFYLTEAIPIIVGKGVWIFGAIGLLIWVVKSRESLPFITFGIAFLVFISSLNLQWVRWLLPLAPLLALGLGQLVETLIARSTVGLWWTRIVAASLGAVIVAPSALETLKHTYLRSISADTRIVSEQWINDNIPCGASILLETYAPQLEDGCHRIFLPKKGGVIAIRELVKSGRLRPAPFFGSIGGHLKGVPFGIIREAGIDFIVVSSWRQRFERERNNYLSEYRVYELISRNTEIVKEFLAAPDLLGPPIQILQVR